MLKSLIERQLTTEMNIDFAPRDTLLTADSIRDHSETKNEGQSISIENLSSYHYKDHAFFNGPKLVLMLAGIHSIGHGRFKPAYVIMAIMWLVWLFQFVYAVEQIFVDDNEFYFIYQRIANLIWCLHSTMIYSIISRTIFHHTSSGSKSVHRNHKYFSAMEYLLQAGVVKRNVCDSRSCAATLESTNEKESKQLTMLAGVLSVFSVSLVLLNTAIVGNQFIGDEEWGTYFPIPHSVGVTVPGITVALYLSLSILYITIE